MSWQAILIIQSFLVLFVPFLLRKLGLFIYSVQFYRILVFLPTIVISFSEIIRIFFSRDRSKKRLLILIVSSIISARIIGRSILVSSSLTNSLRPV
jgi:hypothetical protein